MTTLASPRAVLWALFAVTAASLLALDLGVLQRSHQPPTAKGALAWTALWWALALCFGAAVNAYLGPAKGSEFLSAYLVEKGLSVDNLFVVMLVFDRFRIPASAQRRALVAGVAGAFVLRTVLIVPGVSLVSRFHFLTYLLGGLLGVMAYKLLFEKGDDDAATDEGMLERAVRRILPVWPALDGDRFFKKDRGRVFATPLLVALVVVEGADVVFALDSIPAVIGVTGDSFVALTSNLFAVLGLRSLYFVLTGALAHLKAAKTGLCVVLAVVSCRMLGLVTIPDVAGVVVIAGILAVSALASFVPRRAR